jgi:hypothetical protein
MHCIPARGRHAMRSNSSLEASFPKKKSFGQRVVSDEFLEQCGTTPGEWI